MNGLVMESIDSIDKAFQKIDDNFEEDHKNNRELPQDFEENFQICLGLYIEDLDEKCRTVQSDGWIDHNERKYDAAKRIRYIENENKSVYKTIFEALDRDNALWGELHIVKDYNKASNDDTRYFPWRHELFQDCLAMWEAFSVMRRKRKRFEGAGDSRNEHAKRLMNGNDKEIQKKVENEMTNFSSNPYVVSFSTTSHAAHTD